MRISEHNISESLIIRMANFAVSKAVFDICKSAQYVTHTKWVYERPQ